MHRLTNFLFFGIPLLYYYACLNLLNNLSFLEIYVLIYTYILGTNFNSSIICCLSSGDMYFFLCKVISTSSSLSLCNSLAGFSSKHLLFYQQFYCQSNHQLLLLFFRISLFEAVFIASVVDFLALLRSF